MKQVKDFLGSSVVKTSPSSAGVQIPSLVGELQSYMPPSKNIYIHTYICMCVCVYICIYNRSNLVTNSIKTLKNGPHQDFPGGPVVKCQEAFNKRLPVCCFGSVRNPLVLTDS